MLKENDLKQMTDIHIVSLLLQLGYKKHKDYFDIQNYKTIQNYIVKKFVYDTLYATEQNLDIDMKPTK